MEVKKDFDKAFNSNISQKLDFSSKRALQMLKVKKYIMMKKVFFL
jgi:hypothetical protein